MDSDIAKEQDNVIKVRLQPRASRTGVRSVEEGVVRISVTAPPIDNAANAALIELLAKLLKIPKGSIVLTSGQHSRDKLVQIKNISKNETLRILEIHGKNKS